LRFPAFEKAQFPGTARQGRCVTALGISYAEFNIQELFQQLLRVGKVMQASDAFDNATKDKLYK
jgi:hypothetical protein